MFDDLRFLSQCGVLKEKLDSLLKTLNEESQASSVLPPAPPPTIAEEQEEVEGLVLPPLHLPPPPHFLPISTCSSRPTPSTSSSSVVAAAIFKPREQLMLRANSLKKAIRQIIEHTEKGEPVMVRTHLNRCGGFTEELFRYSSVKSNLHEAVDTQLQSVQLPLSRLLQAGLSEESRCLGRRALKRRVTTGLFSTMDRGAV